MITILLVDDQPAVRRGLRMRLALEPDVTVVGEADDGAKAVEMAASLDPDVVVMDVEMPGMDGIAACTALQERALRSSVVVLTLYDDAAMRDRALAAGAVAFVGKGEAAEALPVAIRRAAQHSSPPGRA
jgi:DNA-binding NarL/FixJ family response regulator